jgi:biofilm PGA synthesis N-glycosyltransferase PgaC
MVWEIFANSLDRFNHFVVGYYVLVNGLNTGLLFVSLWIAVRYFRKIRGHIDYRPLTHRSVPPVSLIRMAFNESASIVKSIRPLLNLNYPDYEVVVVHDGSKDETLKQLVEAFGLKPLDLIYRQILPTSGDIRKFYVNSQFPRLIVVDKENSGKADSLNVGINVAQNPYFCPVDADTVLERDALNHLVRPILEDQDRIVASGGIMRIANGCTIENGQVLQVNLPKDAPSIFQIVEQIRCMLFGQIGWAALHCLWGSFRTLSLFQKKAVLKLGGYDARSVRADMDLMTRLHGLTLEARRYYRVVMVMDQVAWAQLPRRLNKLARQRRNWHQGLVEALISHLNFMRLRYGVMRLLSLLLYAILKMLGPVVEIGGYVTIGLAWTLGVLSTQLMALFLFLVFFYGMFLSMSAVLFEAVTYRRYPTWSHLVHLLFYGAIENFGYRQLISWWRVQATVLYLLRQQAKENSEGLFVSTEPKTLQAYRLAYRKFYLTTRQKFLFSLFIAISWLFLTTYLALPWINDLSAYIPKPLAIFLVSMIALLPGFLNAFIVASLMIDRRPTFVPLSNYPPISLLIAAYNEAQCIRQTVESVLRQGYPGEVEIIVVDDGSTDGTVKVLKSLPYPQLKVLQMAHGGKARALNHGLKNAKHELIITIDADTYLFSGALERIVARLQRDPGNTVAIAGAVLVKNSRETWVTRMQEWDYFHGIASVKRLQSLYHGTLVAQGAFSIYRKSVVIEVGGWPETVGEDIVLTWATLNRGNRIGFADDAVVFTNVPKTYKGFFRQRRRWARGLIEAFKYYPGVLFKPRLSTLFIYWNMFFPVMDFVFLFVFVPGIIVALFGYYFIAGPMTLAVLPLALLINMVMYRIQRQMFQNRRLKVRRNIWGFIWYMLSYQIFMAPASVAGYLAELGGLRKGWGTKK